jgi:hypothetical protein
MSYVDHIIQAFGGVRKCARTIDEPPSNVSGWLRRGTIPDEKKVRLFDAACRLNLPLAPYDFLPFPAQRCSSCKHITAAQTGGQGNGVSHG